VIEDRGSSILQEHQQILENICREKDRMADQIAQLKLKEKAVW
jgi:hypothetical protein